MYQLGNIDHLLNLVGSGKTFIIKPILTCLFVYRVNGKVYTQVSRMTRNCLPVCLQIEWKKVYTQVFSMTGNRLPVCLQSEWKKYTHKSSELM